MASKEQAVIAEIVEKAQDYEKSMTGFMSEIGEWADLFKIRPPVRKSHTYSNPRRTEFFRACNTIGTLMYRMMTSADPFFSLNPVDLDANFDDLETLTHVIKTQLKHARYRANLLKSCMFLPTFGTVIAQEDYRVLGVSMFGRRIPVTTLTPRPMDQVMFDRGTFEIERADWIATSDITSPQDLMQLAQEVKTIKSPWNVKALEAASADKEESNKINPQVLNRIARGGYSNEDAFHRKKELLMYYGKLNAMNDGVEYVAALVNRKFLVRFHANNFQHGRRNFRIAKWIDFDAPWGLGLGKLLANQHRSMDGNLQRMIDKGVMATYNMWKRRKNTVADEDLVIRALQVVDVDNMDDIQPIEVGTEGVNTSLKLDEVLKSEFRNASGAVDTLQAIVTGATASESSLAQNEAMRNISVKAEIAADALVREHVENIHANNVQNVRQPFNINKAGIARRIYPSDLRFDLEIEAKVTTDRDFKPQRLDKLLQAAQIASSTKSNHPELADISIRPLFRAIAYMLDVNPNELVPGSAGAPGLGSPTMGARDLVGLAQSMFGPSSERIAGTPVGPTMVSP